MRESLKFLFAFIAVIIISTSCQKEEENLSQLTDADLLSAKNEAVVESVFEDIDDIGFESFFYLASGGRIEANDDSPIHCATRSHDKENKTIIIDYGEGCTGKRGRERSGKIIITYTDKRFVPGAIHTITFNNFHIDGNKIEGTRIRTNISENADSNLKFKIELVGGKVTFEDGTIATRDAEWETTRIRTPNPINDERIRTGEAKGTNKDGVDYKVTISKPIVWKRGCLSKLKIMIPVEGTKFKEFEDGKNVTIDYGDGSCNNSMTVTIDGESKTVEFKRHRSKG